MATGMSEQETWRASERPVRFGPQSWSERFARRGDLVRTFWVVLLGVVFVLVLLGALIGG